MSEVVRHSCIVPAYNEAPRIAAVLEVALATPGIDEVIVVDDGSSDGTAEAAEALAEASKLRVIRQPENAGKTRAVARGVAEARGTHLLLLDSDLLGLTPDALSALIAPVAAGRSEVSISLRRNTPWPWRVIGLDYISGERVMPRALLAENLAALDTLPKFGLEVWMNRLWIAERYRIAVVHWPEVDSPTKGRKQGRRLAGVASDIAMVRDIFRTVSPLDTLRQIVAMRSRRV